MRIPLILCALAFTAQAHFTFILPDAGGRSARLIVSEKLEADDAVDVKIARAAKLKLRDASGADSDLELTIDKDCLRIKLPGETGPRTIYGFADLGVSPTGRGPKPFLLLYYPKTLIGTPAASIPAVGGEQVVELSPRGEAGHISLLLTARGKPLAAAEITVLLPGGSETKVKTGSDGVAGPFAQHGRFGAWARFWEDGSGVRDGKPYEQVRHYATLVFDAFPQAVALAPLPEATSSFGAVADGQSIYVYGGHISPTHTYSTASVSGKFNRWDPQSQRWVPLPAGPGLQGLNLAAHEGLIYRVGGMEPRNKPGDKSDTHSIIGVSRFDPKANAWQSVTALPEARSSHDVAVIGGTLIVTGGWNLRGSDPTLWAKTTVTLDLTSPQAEWKSVAQPFERRALITAAFHDRMYVMGGIMPSGSVSTDVDIFDPASGAWSKGPALPGAAISGFAPAAVVHNGALYVSGGDGGIYRLIPDGSAWQDAGQTTPRLAHRMVSSADGILILGGATKGVNLDLVECIRP